MRTANVTATRKTISSWRGPSSWRSMNRTGIADRGDHDRGVDGQFSRGYRGRPVHAGMPQHVSGQARTEVDARAVAVANVEPREADVAVAVVRRGHAQFAVALLHRPFQPCRSGIRPEKEHRDRIAQDEIDHAIALSLLIGTLIDQQSIAFLGRYRLLRHADQAHGVLGSGTEVGPRRAR